MRFDPELVEAATPAVRIEVQGWLAQVDGKRRDFKASGKPERRGRKPWPRVWFRNDADYAYCARQGATRD